MLKILFSISPAILILLFFYFKDKFREPPVHVFQAFFLGIMIVLPVVLVNEIFYDDFCWNKIQGSYFGKSVYNHLSRVAFQEELWKFLILFFFFSHLMEEPMDGIVYGVAVSLGFSAYENIDYVFRADKFNISWTYMSFVRILPTFMHFVTGAFMGLFIALNLLYYKNKNNYFYIFFLSVVFHASYNVFLDFFFYSTIFILFIAVTAMFYFYKLISKEQIKNLKELDKIPEEFKSNPERLFYPDPSKAKIKDIVFPITSVFILVHLIAAITLFISPNLTPEIYPILEK